MKYALQVAYNGSAFFGFQRQPKEKTVQGEIERVLSKLFGETVELAAAGRTDTGVHAEGQVVGFETQKELPLEAVVDAANGRLGDQICLVRGSILPEGDFHPRFSALERTYRYLVLSGCCRESNTIWGGNFWCVGPEIGADLASKACQVFLGEHDFLTFSSRSQLHTTVREVKSFDIEPLSWPGAENAWVFTITANAFLRKMVRLLVAAAVEAGMDRVRPLELSQRLAARDSALGPHPAPASGLYFSSVEYDPDPFSSEGLALEVYEGRKYLGFRSKVSQESRS